MLHRTQKISDTLGEIKNLPNALEFQFPSLPEPLLQLSEKSMLGLKGTMVSPRPVNLTEIGIEDGDTEDDLDLSRLQSLNTMKRTAIQPVR